MDRKIKRKMDGGESFDSLPARKLKPEELEVTGVSRSGRVRKKSSKLMDFESPDEIDIRNSRKKEKPDFNTPNISRPVMAKKPGPVKQEMTSEEEEGDSSGIVAKDGQFSDDSEHEAGFIHNDESSLDSLGSELEDVDEADLERDDAEAFQPIVDETAEDAPSQAQSLYMLEKSSKKKLVIKDGKIVGRTKTQRKDKGKARFTAYMLWAKEIRQELMRANPDLDFSQLSKKLGELWATVPYNEKYIWKRRAQRLAAKGCLQQLNSGATPTTPQEPGKKMRSPPGRKFINKQSQQSPAVTPIQSSSLPSSPPAALSSSPTDTKPSKQSQQQDLGPQSVFKPVGTSPLDVAAHLRLLGESLAIVGERLTEHEGQIAVSGSFSVLLDSLLCALVPLLCLTQQVPELNVIPQEQLSQAMDNIAYIMPGL